MNPKHVDIRVQQCLVLAEASNCPRRKFAAVLIDPERNVVLADGYNGGPRGGGKFCGGSEWCLRDGAPTDVDAYRLVLPQAAWAIPDFVTGTDSFKYHVFIGDQKVGKIRVPSTEAPDDTIRRFMVDFVPKHPPIASGTRIEVGCVHAEMNVICNAAAQGTATRGMWLIVTGEPCLMCAKLIHHAGIAKLLCVKGGYLGGSDGTDYLQGHGVKVEYVEGPKDPRA